MPTPKTKWNGLCPAGKHGLDFEGQPCDLCPSTPKSVATKIDPVGHNLIDILEYCAVRRPDVVSQIEQLSQQDAFMFLLAIGYAAGRVSVVAELDGIEVREAAARL